MAPRTPVEELLAEIWADAEVSDLDHLGINDNFFDLGGHSLLATRVISRVRRTFQVDVPIRSLFEAPTVAQLAKVVIAHEASAGQAEEIAGIVKRVRETNSKDLGYEENKKVPDGQR